MDIVGYEMGTEGEIKSRSSRRVTRKGRRDLELRKEMSYDRLFHKLPALPTHI